MKYDDNKNMVNVWSYCCRGGKLFVSQKWVNKKRMIDGEIRSGGQSVYLYTRDDEYARRLLMAHAEERVKELKAQLDRMLANIEILKEEV